jgi:hypothetical protein
VPIKEHLYVHDWQHLSVHEDFVVFGQYCVDDYLHGRCHLMALAIREQTGLQCGVILDLESDYDADGEPLAALDHAFCELGQAMEGYVIDARGVRSRLEIQEEYNQALEPELISGPEAENLIREWIATALLEDFLPGEHEALVLYVEALQKYPCMVILDNASSWNALEGREKPAPELLFKSAGASCDLSIGMG